MESPVRSWPILRPPGRSFLFYLILFLFYIFGRIFSSSMATPLLISTFIHRQDRWQLTIHGSLWFHDPLRSLWSFQSVRSFIYCYLFLLFFFNVLKTSMTLCWDFSTGSDRHSPVKRSWWSLRSWWLWSSSVGNVARCWAFFVRWIFYGVDSLLVLSPTVILWDPLRSFEILWDPWDSFDPFCHSK